MEELLNLLSEEGVGYEEIMEKSGVYKVDSGIIYHYDMIPDEYILVTYGVDGKFYIVPDSFDSDMFLGTLEIMIGCQFCHKALQKCNKILRNRHKFIDVVVVEHAAPNFYSEQGQGFEGLKKIVIGLEELKKTL